MALEDLTGTKYIDSLVITNPEGTDVRHEGDDHLRGIKNVLKKTWANITGAVTATHTDLDKTKQFPTVSAGDAFKGLRVNAGETAYEFVADIGASTANITNYTATAGQTTFSGADDDSTILAYVAGYLQVYLNGILLEDTTDYVATNGTSVVLNTGASVGDVLQAFGFGTFDLADHYTKTQVDANKYDKTETYSQTESDAAFAPINERNRRNLIINGNFNVWQRQVSFTTLATATFTADHFKHFRSNDAVVDVYRNSGSSAVPFSYYLDMDVTGADTSIGAAQYELFEQKIEGYSTAFLQWGSADAKAVTLSFKHAHTKTGTYCVTLRNDANDRCYVAEYTQSVADAWEQADITIPGCTDGTWILTSECGIAVRFAAAAGSNYNATADTWTSSGVFSTANQVNGLDSTSNFIRFAQIQLIEGSEAADFEERPLGEELALCQRYYEKSYSTTTYPGGTATVGAPKWAVVQDTSGDGTHQHPVNQTFTTPKRGSPTITWYAPSTGTINKIYDHTNSTTRSIDSLVKENQHQTGYMILSGSRNAGTILSAHWVADAEI